MKNKNNKKGFTLTELIVVIVIIGILAAVLIPTLTGYIKKANQSADEQELANLNKVVMLYDYEDTKPTSVVELKKLLSNEGYKGNYKLRVDGNYLWYDVNENRFTIINEKNLPTESSELINLATGDDYKLVSTLKSPEGLLNNNGGEVWLVGGNGELVELVSSLRNIANLENPQDVLENVYKGFKSINLDNALTQFVNSSKFFNGSSILAFEISESGSISVTGNYDDRNFVYVDDLMGLSYLETIDNFHKGLLYSDYYTNDDYNNNLDYINSLIQGIGEISCDDQQQSDGSYKIVINITDSTRSASEIVSSVMALIEILGKYNTGLTKVNPITQSGMVSDEEFNYFILKDEVLSFLENNIIDLTQNDQENNVTAIYTKVSFLIFGCMFYDENLQEGSTVVPDDDSETTIASLLTDNSFIVNATINDPINGKYNIIYSFEINDLTNSNN